MILQGPCYFRLDTSHVKQSRRRHIRTENRGLSDAGEETKEIPGACIKVFKKEVIDNAGKEKTVVSKLECGFRVVVEPTTRNDLTQSHQGLLHRCVASTGNNISFAEIFSKTCLLNTQERETVKSQYV